MTDHLVGRSTPTLLLAEVRNQQRLLLEMNRTIPLPAPPRDQRGAILIDDYADLEAC